MKWNETRKIARLISRIDNGELSAEKQLAELYKDSGQAYVIGVTGPPGAGKSSLTDALAKLYLKEGKKVAIIAVDPTSPFSGGAILGDRIRMGDLTTDPNVFIRSLGTRGHLGGLSASTHLASLVLDAAGADVIFIESVGVGQSEIEIVKVSQTVLMVMVPGLGDDIQSMKAGIMEIGDVFAVNKADLNGAERTVRDLEQMLTYASDQSQRPKVIKASVVGKFGIEEIKQVLDELRGREENHSRSRQNTQEILLEILNDKIRRKLMHEETFHTLVEAVQRRETDPYSAAEQLMEELK